MATNQESTGKKIGTHNGTFHCDEALACFMLRKTSLFRGAESVRTRDPSVLEKMDVVVDVGGVYDPERFRFDHHQLGFTGTLEGFNTKLSSAGLIYKHFGKEIIPSELNTDQKTTDLVFNKVYESFMEAIDAIDNGIDRYPPDVKPKYKMSTDLGSRVGGLNPFWNDTTSNVDERFHRAVEMTGPELLDVIHYFGKAWLPARDIVVKAIQSRFDVDPSGEIMLLDNFCPWKGYVLELEPELGVQKPIKFVLFPDQSGQWRVQCVPIAAEGFENRKSLPWRGLRDEELSKASGIPGGVFVHVGGFIGGNKTKEGALQMAQKALQMDS
jgi:uncharacterized UPF0160 family protein